MTNVSIAVPRARPLITALRLYLRGRPAVRDAMLEVTFDTGIVMKVPLSKRPAETLAAYSRAMKDPAHHSGFLTTKDLADSWFKAGTHRGATFQQIVDRIRHYRQAIQQRFTKAFLRDLPGAALFSFFEYDPSLGHRLLTDKIDVEELP